MYRFTFIFIFNVLLFTTCAFAQNDLHENLYIPEGAFDASVKLPPIKLGTYENMPTIKRASSPQNQSKSTLPSNSSSSISKALPNPSSSSSSEAETEKEGESS